MALPLLAAALVCLLATSGVWLFSNTGGDDKNNDTAIGLNVPTAGVNVPPNRPAENMTGSKRSGSAAPSGSATGPTAVSASPSKPGVKSPTPAGSSATSQAPPRPDAPTGQAPAPTTGPASPSAPPPPAPSPPPTVSAAGEATKSWGITKLTVTVTYPPGAPYEEWVLTATDGWQCDTHKSAAAKCRGRGEARGTGEAPSDGRVQITFTIYGAGDRVSYRFNNETTTVLIR
ncbi:hypothetical protein LO772_24075 [Yinghuangia sp. ASG 101]|uniref:hypothetical protein n=1 Tax=Yinghuangia sp. ASG 101 TaxID=2896848 RepID=UPI001E5F7442|nr:hypothetical protein [Yinghuangia sp. ASG 101]UGQ09954.1 hypothetical protein LO772_24075 [Yinghuangia sp. ASG 101]